MFNTELFWCLSYFGFWFVRFIPCGRVVFAVHFRAFALRFLEACRLPLRFLDSVTTRKSNPVHVITRAQPFVSE